MFSQIPDLINFIIEAHWDFPKRPGSIFRKHDGKTPYWAHPIWSAITILQEQNLPEKIRVVGAEALLLHDILEDTCLKLPNYVTEEVKALVGEMTFESSEEEMDKIWERSNLAKLFKLYDKVSNLLDYGWMTAEKRRRYCEYTLKLADFVEEKFGELNIVKMAKAIAQETPNP